MPDGKANSIGGMCPGSYPKLCPCYGKPDSSVTGSDSIQVKVVRCIDEGITKRKEMSDWSYESVNLRSKSAGSQYLARRRTAEALMIGLSMLLMSVLIPMMLFSSESLL